MGKEEKRKRYVHFCYIVLILISIMTWFYPYSLYSLHKSYAFHPDKLLHNGKTYEEIVEEFKDTYEKDLKNNTSNLTISRTQYILPFFEQDLLLNKESIRIDAMTLDKMIFEIRKVKENFFTLLVQVDYTSEQRGYLIDNIKNLSSIENIITHLKTGIHLSRSELNQQFNYLYRELVNGFDLFITFYDRSH